MLTRVLKRFKTYLLLRITSRKV